jgi:hypothetical protein
MLISIEKGHSMEMLARLRENYPRAAVIGHVVEKGDTSLVVK